MILRILGAAQGDTKIWAYGLLLSIVMLALAVRLTHLEADPPDHLSFSRSIYNDGGTYALNARQNLLKGTWRSPGDNVYAQAPGYTVAARVAFAAFGLGLPALRILSIAGSMGALLLVAWGGWRAWGSADGVLTALLLACDYLFMMYGRLELIEGFLVGVCTGGVVAAVRAAEPWHSEGVPGQIFRSSGWAITSACLLFAALTIKPTAAISFVPAAVVLLYRPWIECRQSVDNRISCRQLAVRHLPLLAFTATLGLLCLAYILWFYLPHRELFAQFREAFRENAAGLWDTHPLAMWLQILTVPGLWRIQGLPLTLLAMAGVSGALKDWVVARGSRQDGRQRDLNARLQGLSLWGLAMVAWLVAGFLYLAPQTYRPSRFGILYLPAAAALAAKGVLWLWEYREGLRAALNPVAAVACLAWVAWADEARPGFHGHGTLGVDLAVTALAAGAMGAVRATRTWRPLPWQAGPACAVVLVVAAVAMNLAPTVRWVMHPRYTLFHAGRAMGEIAGGQAVAGDNWCASLALMYRSPAYKIDWLRVPAGELRALRVRYLVYDSREARVPELYGKLIRAGKVVTQLQVGHYKIKVVRLDWAGTMPSLHQRNIPKT
jgi:4-amino-4-deoxy-L-arabinose transferase-like glycosyltransferase